MGRKSPDRVLLNRDVAEATERQRFKNAPTKVPEKDYDKAKAKASARLERRLKEIDERYMREMRELGENPATYPERRKANFL